MNSRKPEDKCLWVSRGDHERWISEIDTLERSGLQVTGERVSCRRDLNRILTLSGFGLLIVFDDISIPDLTPKESFEITSERYGVAGRIIRAIKPWEIFIFNTGISTSKNPHTGLDKIRYLSVPVDSEFDGLVTRARKRLLDQAKGETTSISEAP